MKTGYGFTEFESIREFEEWLNKQKVSRTVNKLQVHHMYEPSYDNWGSDNALRRQNNIRSYHKNTNGWADIAQNFSIFPDGHIVTGRSLNSTPVGIKGWNTGSICIEIYGDFDKGRDIMNSVQKEAIIACYALLAKKFNIPINSNGIRPHCWFTAGGTYLGDYNKSKSAKSCPGTNFMGYGNTKSAFERFYNDVKNYGKSNNTSTNSVTESNVNQTGLVNATSLNVRSGSGTNHSILGKLKNNVEVTIVAKCSNGWLKIKYGSGYGYVSGQYIDNIKNTQTSSTTQLSGKYIVRYLQQVLNSSYKLNLDVDGLYGTKTKNAVKSHLLKKGCRGDHVVWLQKALINRGYKINADGIFGNDTLNAVKKYQQSRGLKSDGYAGVDTHTAIVND